MTDIQELFSRDPLSFTKEGGEIATIVAKLRESRGQYRLGAQKAGAMKAPTGKAAQAASKLASGGLKLNISSLLAKKE
jgi:hypothetical protein